jgi:hypothetical protein
LQIGTKEFEIIEIGVEEDVDLGSGMKDSILSIVVLQGEAFYCSKLWKWTTSLADSTRVIC